MFQPGQHTESDVLVGYLAQQLDALRAAAYGLTDEQARQTPCRSALSIGGLIKHATYVLEGRVQPHRDPDAAIGDDDVARFMGSFALTPAESFADALAAFDRAVTAYLEVVRAVDPGAPMIEAPAPWDGRYEPTPSVERFSLVHHIEEFARHAGHADIIREQLDGADAASLLMALEGREGNAFVQPWQAAPAH
ncbi:MAG: DinB family protein [Jatrophihabitans sp.]|uniref:DinB family protein n=1 Tax=Jatrophihabitans sp. TaxID=1932789 RepID=UPI003F8213F0